MTHIELTHDLLVRLSVTENLTADQIAEQTGYSRSWVFYRLKEEGLVGRRRQVTVRSGTRIQPDPVPDRPYELQKSNRKIPGRDWLLQRYWTDNRTVVDIGKELGVNPNSVTKALHRYDIKIKPRIVSYQGKERRIGDWSKSMKKAIHERDGYTCQRCGGTQRLEAHHIIPLRIGGKNAIDNGITLCEPCHTKIGYSENDHIGEFLEILHNKKG